MHYDIFMFQLQADLPNNAINGVRIRIKLQNTIHVVFFVVDYIGWYNTSFYTTGNVCGPITVRCSNVSSLDPIFVS